MISLYDELLERVERDPRMPARNRARQDLGVLLFSRREDIAALWKAAARSASGARSDDLAAAVERRRPGFGER